MKKENEYKQADIDKQKSCKFPTQIPEAKLLQIPNANTRSKICNTFVLGA